MYISYAWLMIAAATLLIELGHPGLFLFVSISMGALGAAGLALGDGPLSYQLAGFIGITLISWALLRRFITLQKSGYANSVHALIGAHGVVTKRITPNHAGHVRVRGEEWLARSLHDAPLEIGTNVQIVRVERTTVMVTKQIS